MKGYKGMKGYNFWTNYQGNIIAIILIILIAISVIAGLVVGFSSNKEQYTERKKTAKEYVKAKRQPVDCEMTQWTMWSECDKKCGGGSQSRSREIIKEPLRGGKECGELKENRECNKQECGKQIKHKEGCITMGNRMYKNSFTLEACDPNNNNQLYTYDSITKQIRNGDNCMWAEHGYVVGPRKCEDKPAQKLEYDNKTKQLKTYNNKCLNTYKSWRPFGLMTSTCDLTGTNQDQMFTL